MRVVFVGLLLVLAACSSPAESAETTTSPVSASTTSTSTTTTTLAVTTTTEPECVERDGVLKDNRGFVCPPILTYGESPDDIVGYRSGTYTTGVFEPGFSFARDGDFQSGGENILLVALDGRPNCRSAECGREMFALSPEFASPLRAFPFDSLEWVLGLSVSTVEYWGFAGTQIDFSVGTCLTPEDCLVQIDSPVDRWGWGDGHQVRLLFIDVPSGPVGFEIASHQSRFDQYWTEVAEPLLASIEFTDS